MQNTSRLLCYEYIYRRRAWLTQSDAESEKAESFNIMVSIWESVSSSITSINSDKIIIEFILLKTRF